MGGIFAVSTVIPGKVYQLAVDLLLLSSAEGSGVGEHALQLFGCFLLLSILIWASKCEPRSVRPLLAYPPHHRESVMVHASGLLIGVVILFLR
ncbi:MAG: hypothetical protein NTZ53_00750 [Cyanobacteria bacterium]|nr:hypothetical protein [Cyanobacteriota bacterium]